MSYSNIHSRVIYQAACCSGWLLGLAIALLCATWIADGRQDHKPNADAVRVRDEKFNRWAGKKSNQSTEETFERGVVIKNVVSGGDPTKSYALYLPTTYSADRSNDDGDGKNDGGSNNASTETTGYLTVSQSHEGQIAEPKAVPDRGTPKKFPIIYCFDPSARGAVPVERFKDAAEKYGYIVVGSNNSRNGSQQLSAIVRDLWDDTHARFSIDDRRVYLAGFSGGARVAISVAFWLKDRIAGVIACGGGFPADIPPTTARSFVLFAVAGTEDFNNPELQTLARRLDGSTPPIRLAVFEGGHNWLPPELAKDAVEWWEVQAMKAGIRDRDPALINEMFEHTLSQASAAAAGGDRYRAYRHYAAMAQDFSGLHDVAEVETKAKELSATKEVKDALKQEKRIEEEQNYRIENIHKLIAAHEAATEKFESLAALRDELKSQREAAKGTQQSVKRTVARRVMGSLFVEFFELGNTAMARKEYERAVTYFSLCGEIQPDNAHAFYFLARVHALAGSRNKALEALKAAAEKGFKGVRELEGKEFEDLQTDKRFREVMELVRKN